MKISRNAVKILLQVKVFLALLENALMTLEFSSAIEWILCVCLFF